MKQFHLADERTNSKRKALGGKWEPRQGQPRFVDFRKIQDLAAKGLDTPEGKAAITAWPKDEQKKEINPDWPPRPIDRNGGVWAEDACRYCYYVLGRKEDAAHSCYGCPEWRNYLLSTKHLASVHTDDFPGKSSRGPPPGLRQ